MREFKRLLNSDVPSAAIWNATVKKLEARLSKGINLVTALAQPPRSESATAAKFYKAQDARYSKELADIRADLDTALGGKAVETERLVRQLLAKGCDATTCGIRYDECNGATVIKLKKLLKIED